MHGIRCLSNCVDEVLVALGVLAELGDFDPLIEMCKMLLGYFEVKSIK